MVISLNIPDGSRCLLKENQKVEFGNPYLVKKAESRIEIPISKKLDIDSSKIFHYLKKLVGEKVVKGETLALKKNLFSTIRVKSDFDGVIQEINHDEGIIIITISEGEDQTVNSHFRGKVKKISANEIKIEIGQSEEYKLSLASSDFGGQTLYLTPDKTSFASSDAEGRVIVGKSIASYDLAKAEALGAVGFLTQDKIEDISVVMDYAQLKNISDIEEILKHGFPYCLIDKKNSRIVFYK